MIHHHFYDSPVPASDDLPSIFLAGPTTWSEEHEGRVPSMSRWRAEFCDHLPISATVIVPEFSQKGDFEKHAEDTFGRSIVPTGIPVKPRSWGLLQWEKVAMASAQVVVAWMDCRDSQPGLGLNARPEIQGLIERHAMAAPWPQRLVLGISEETTGGTRFWALAHEAGLPVARSISELITHTTRALARPVVPSPWHEVQCFGCGVRQTSPRALPRGWGKLVWKPGLLRPQGYGYTHPSPGVRLFCSRACMEAHQGSLGTSPAMDSDHENHH